LRTERSGDRNQKDTAESGKKLQIKKTKQLFDVIKAPENIRTFPFSASHLYNPEFIIFAH
jgi:hypothetical protein